MRTVLTFMIQWGGERYHHGSAALWQPLLLVLLGIGAGAIVIPLLDRIVPRARRWLRGWRRRRRRRRDLATAERRARALMTELCPYGWRAEITLVESTQVRLAWTELRDDSGAPAVMREVRAGSISEALDAMVSDRQTDETLERIEQGAVAEGAHWPDLD